MTWCKQGDNDDVYKQGRSERERGGRVGAGKEDNDKKKKLLMNG